ncbi:MULTISPECIES: FHA domain-containing protein [Pseudomonas]|uniref:FHA domain-containing protein n=1 Tax=Pseudomonas TaxID=286 RepID=UPI0018D7143F|nr:MULTISPECIES: FHA domain-containing protein [Pseudomonas]MBH3460526.1 FHA domain-containing protein [Pseudomonas putida]MBK0060499.1 FHA domain-containing protein [Pseudomonas sp. S44]
MSTLTLSIINLEQLPHDVTVRHQFDCAGGTIGSAEATWRINDREGSVAPIHCEIRWLEGSFCVIDLCQRTYLNDSLDSLESLTARRLLDDDRLRIGALRLLVQLSHTDVRSLEDLFSPEQRTLDQWLLDVPAQSWQSVCATREAAIEICSAFEPGVGSDPLAALDTVTGPAQQNSLESLIAGKHP